MHISELLYHTTIKINTLTPNGGMSGTGFFLGLDEKENGDFIPVIVTNKHVVKDASVGTLRFSIMDDNNNGTKGDYYEYIMKDFEDRWLKHPDNDVDLCIMPITKIHRELEQIGKRLFCTRLSLRDIPCKSVIDNDLSRIEDVIVVGYPDGLWDEHNNLPICRKGITATPLQYDFNNTPRFLIDAAIYPGSSGSPVFIFNQSAYSKSDGKLYSGDRLLFIGVVHAVAFHKVDGKLAIVDIPSALTPITQTSIPNNLGVVIHARKLLDFNSLIQAKIQTSSS